MPLFLKNKKQRRSEKERSVETAVCPQPSTDGSRSPVAELIGASKVFKTGGGEITALHKTDLKLFKNELLLIVGPSGSGKTTLLSLLGCILYPTEGSVCIGGLNTRHLDDRRMAELRRSAIGFVFQNFNLIAPLTSEENIMAPLLLNKVPGETIREKIGETLSLLGLNDRRKSLPKQLSGGEQQRVAIARALIGAPSIILCDEPTASLDTGSFEVILKELRSLADSGKAVAVVTHDNRLKDYANKIVYLEDGKVVENSTKE